MLLEHAKLLAMLKNTGSIAGRKKLQKMVYIAKRMKQPFREKFQFHMYGPYSEELTLQVEEMCNASFVEEVKEKISGYYQYRYSLSDKGESFLHAVLDEEEPIDSQLMQELNGCSSKFLELVSTVLYFDELPREQVEEKIYRLKARQNYQEADIEDAYAFIQKLKQRAR
ncbi:YwgA family protein [Bacillus daqingensis]|uniref:YwgA family protein n=1 Tax=Bacillus daqingensis TaxID=872396 RepID=A0ABV9NVK7_9BACI